MPGESGTPGGSGTSRSSGRRKGLALALFEAPEQGAPIADELTAHAPAARLAPRHEALGLDAVAAPCAEHFHLGQIGRAEAMRIRSCGILRSCRKCDGNGKRFLSPPLPHAAPACRALSRSGSPLQNRLRRHAPGRCGQPCESLAPFRGLSLPAVGPMGRGAVGLESHALSQRPRRPFRGTSAGAFLGTCPGIEVRSRASFGRRSQHAKRTPSGASLPRHALCRHGPCTQPCGVRIPLRSGRDIHRGKSCDFHRFRDIRFASRMRLESLPVCQRVCQHAKETPSGASRARRALCRHGSCTLPCGVRTPLGSGGDIRRGKICDFHRFRYIRFNSRMRLESLPACQCVRHFGTGTPSGASHASPFRHVPDSLRTRVAPLPTRPACARARLRGVFGRGLVQGYGFWFPVLGSWGIAL